MNRLRPRWIRVAALGFGLAVAVSACAVDEGSTATTTSSVAAAPPGGPGDTTPLAMFMDRQMTWTQWHGTRLPHSDRWGPAHVNGDVATGFDHSPEGAVLAMTQQQARLAGVSDKDWTAAAKSMAVVAPSEQPPVARISTGFDSSGDLPYFSGFRWISYTPDRAVSDLALQLPDASLRTVRVTEVWSGGDWKTELPAGGATATLLTGFDQYQPWPGTPR